MPKAVLNNRIYLEVDDEYKAFLRDELTYSIPSSVPNMPNFTIRNMSMLKKGIASIPVGRTDLIPDGYEIVDKRANIPAKFPDFAGTLRDSQQAIYDEIEGSAMVNANVSFGKTFTGLAIAGKFAQKTLVVTHTIPIRNQWVREIEKVYGFTPDIIGSGKFGIDTPIVVGNVQTLYNKIEGIYNRFGTVILDECLDYNSYLTTRTGRQTIGTIVNGKKFIDVLSFNENTKTFEWKPILRHFKNPQKDLMIKFIFDSKSVLKCTMNHSIYSYNKGNIKAEDLVEGDLVISEKSHKTSALLTQEAKSLVLGMILGDGHLSTNGTNCRLRITHGEAQLDYLKYKINIIEDAFKSSLTEGSSGYKPENSVFMASSLSFHDLDNWKQKLYSDNSSKNCVPKDLTKTLTKETWSIIYQDDGSISKGKYIQFSLCELDEDSINNLIESLYNIFGIKGKQFVCKKGFRYLTLGLDATKIFVESIADLIHPCLEYKKGIYAKNVKFIGINKVKAFEDFTVQKVVKIDFEKATGGNRYNIEVQDNHNYVAGGKLVSNCHHCSAPTFSRIVDRCTSTYKLGLSGTLKRKDGKDVVFRDYFGNKIFKPPAENFVDPEIHIYSSPTKLPDGANTPWAVRVNHVAYSFDYQNEIALIAAKYAALGHKVLVVSDRVEFLKNCALLIGSNAISITGENGHEEREELIKLLSYNEIDVLCGTQSIFSEGISVNELSCLILATPINNEPLLRQLIGRIQRILKGKLKPVVVDVRLRGNTAKRQGVERTGMYMRQGWSIKTI